MDRRIFNRNQNSRRNRRRSVDSLRDEMKEKIEDFRETFVNAKEPSSLHIVLEETHHDALDMTIKSPIVSDFLSQNRRFVEKQSISLQKLMLQRILVDTHSTTYYKH